MKKTNPTSNIIKISSNKKPNSYFKLAKRILFFFNVI